MDARASHDGRAAVNTTMAQRAPKQRASVGMNRVSHAPPFPLTAMPGSGSIATGQADAGKVRRGSIRHAVRKIFGRSSRDVAPRSPQVSAPIPAQSRHVYHKSEPVVLPPQPHPELPYTFQDDAIVPQAVLTTHIRAKTGSPYAVSFPKSAMLKPMNLGNPFIPDAGQMRRRKTMPSTGVLVREAAYAAANVPVPVVEVNTMPDVDADLKAKRALSQIKKARRKSRSTDDLVGTGAETSPQRQRNDEIRYWRESFQPDVLRASGFTSNKVSMEHPIDQRPSPQQERLEDGEQTPVVQTKDSFESARSSRSSSPNPQTNNSEHSRPSSPPEDDRDLEHRLCKLEAGLNTFQRSLERLTADRNRRTIVLHSSTTRRSSSETKRTPSMLADTLSDTLEPAPYDYEYGRTSRSPRPPPPLRPQPQFDSENYTPPTPQSNHYADSVRLPTPPLEKPSSPSGSEHYTFRSVYQMLSTERTARQKLESQLNALQREISDLHAQVNVTSTSHRSNDRNSHMLVGSSARLQQLLQETGEEESNLPTPLPAVESRFSNSESEEQSGAGTPHAAYLTPREERSQRSLAGRLANNEDLDCMF